MTYLYYPGCSLKGTGRGYEESLLAVFDALKLPWAEIEDWNCCGATAYMAVDEVKAFTLAARNLAIAREQGGETAQVIAPCSACYLVLCKAQHVIHDSPEIGARITNALQAAQLTYGIHVRVRHPLDVLVNDVGIEKLAAAATTPLKGRKIACYYGCQIVRPYATFDDQYNPTSMDRVLGALGAETVEWPLKTRCCGGTLTGTIEEAGLRLNYILLREAKLRGADAIATACPLCQFNLECYQDKISAEYGATRLPVLYFSQFMGMAMGLSETQLGMQRNFVPLAAV
ncbi:MAG: Cysteine-rich domain protein [bacterium ADurb.Bin429]|nr:MAG: Cysteine-rich domain protein [bacterium ADurb.Bin429]